MASLLDQAQLPGMPMFFSVSLNGKAKRTPTLDQRDTRGWVKYGQRNQFPDEIVEVARMSPTVAAIHKRYVDYTAGEGAMVVKADGSPWPEAQAWANSLDDGAGLESLVFSAAHDWWLFGAFSFQVLWGEVDPKVKDVLRQDWQNIRLGYSAKPDEDDEYEKGVWVSPLWSKYTKSVYEPKFYPYFREGEPKMVPAFFVEKAYTAGFDSYPLPPWYSGYKAGQTEAELETMRYNLAERAIMPSGVLEVPMALDPEKRKEFERQLREEFTGADNAGKVWLIPNPMGAEGAKVNFTPFTNGPQDRDLRNLQEQVQASIVKAFALPSPTLIGLPGGASLGGDGGTIERASSELYSKVIKPAQGRITRALEMMLNAAGYSNAVVKIKQSYPGFDAEGNALTASVGVSGALAQATTALLAAVQQKQLGPDAAQVLLEQLGYSAEKAKRMVDSQLSLLNGAAPNPSPAN